MYFCFVFSFQQTFENWSIVFYLAGSVSLCGVFIFGLFGSAEEQPWNRFPDSSSTFDDDVDSSSSEVMSDASKPPFVIGRSGTRASSNWTSETTIEPAELIGYSKTADIRDSTVVSQPTLKVWHISRMYHHEERRSTTSSWKWTGGCEWR